MKQRMPRQRQTFVLPQLIAAGVNKKGRREPPF
jgi:hypothetical protein